MTSTFNQRTCEGPPFRFDDITNNLPWGRCEIINGVCVYDGILAVKVLNDVYILFLTLLSFYDTREEMQSLRVA